MKNKSIISSLFNIDYIFLNELDEKLASHIERDLDINIYQIFSQDYNTLNDLDSLFQQRLSQTTNNSIIA
jgi:hypothetical protein